MATEMSLAYFLQVTFLVSRCAGLALFARFSELWAPAVSDGTCSEVLQESSW